MNKKLAGTGLAIGLVAGAGAGLILELSGNVGAASGNPTAVVVVDSSTDATADTTAPADPVRPDPSTRLGDVLKPLVVDGTITQDQADKVIAAIVAARPVDGPGMGGPMGGGHRGFGGPGGRIGFGLDVVSTTLGITADEVRTALEGGQSLADLAVSKGKTAQDVIDAIVAEATTKLNTAVTDGKLTQAEADTRLADITTHATEFVNSTPPVGGPGFGGPGHHGDDNDADDDAPVGATAPTDTTATTDTVAG